MTVTQQARDAATAALTSVLLPLPHYRGQPSAVIATVSTGGNAYDTPDGRVVIDLCNYERMFDRDILGPFGDGGMARLERWELDPQKRTASITVIDDTPNEFPRHRGSFSLGRLDPRPLAGPRRQGP